MLPPVYFLAALLVMVTLHYSMPGMRLIDTPWRYSGIILIAGGIGIILWAALLFRRAGTAIKPFEESSALVAAGPYRLTRNPMYLGMAGTLLGTGVMLGSVTPLLVVPAFAVTIDLRFIRYEEAALERAFGREYIDYRSRVRRWL